MIDLQTLYSLDKAETKRRMLDYLYRKVDDQFRKEDLEPIHDLLNQIDIDKISIQLGVGLLTITKELGSCESRVNFSRIFREKIERTEGQSRVARLLSGIEEVG